MILFFLQPSFFCLASYIYVYLASVLYGLLNRLATKQLLNMYCIYYILKREIFVNYHPSGKHFFPIPNKDIMLLLYKTYHFIEH